MTSAPAKTTRKLPSWIGGFLEWTDPLPSPLIFRKWAAISAIAGALERRVFIQTMSPNPIYPNLFILLVGPPGTGKDQALDPMLEIWQDVGKFHIAPKAMTHKGFLDELGDPARVKTISDILKMRHITYHSLLIACPELGVLVPGHDLAFLSTLNDLYNCPPSYEERNRGRGEAFRIENPHIHIISGTQPKYLGTLFPEEAYGMGFTSRIIMVYAGAPPKRSLFGSLTQSKKDRAVLASDLEAIADLRGQFTLDDDAVEAIERWHAVESDADRPTHSKLIHYNTRRILHLLKLCMVFSVSRSNSLAISLEDFKQAHATLLEVEFVMPEIFKEISSGGQASEIEEAFHFIMRSHSKTKRPVPEHRLVNFLSTRVPVNQIHYMISTMISSKMIRETSPDATAITAGLKERFFAPVGLNISEDL